MKHNEHKEQVPTRRMRKGDPYFHNALAAGENKGTRMESQSTLYSVQSPSDILDNLIDDFTQLRSLYLEEMMQLVVAIKIDMGSAKSLVHCLSWRSLTRPVNIVPLSEGTFI